MEKAVAGAVSGSGQMRQSVAMPLAENDADRGGCVGDDLNK